MLTINRSGAVGEHDSLQHGRTSRREFLKRLGVLPVAAMATEQIAKASPTPAGETKLPVIRFGKYSLSRLICGANPFNAGSHLSVFVNYEMRRYYTPEQIIKTLRRCQEVGINCWQGSGDDYKLYRRFIEQVGKMHYLSLGFKLTDIEELSKAGALGIAYYGERTDHLFKAGQLDKIQDYLKCVRDAGMMVGVSTHMPAVIEAIEDKGWDVDFYMTCIYERHRSAAELEKLLGQAPI